MASSSTLNPQAAEFIPAALQTGNPQAEAANAPRKSRKARRKKRRTEPTHQTPEGQQTTTPHLAPTYTLAPHDTLVQIAKRHFTAVLALKFYEEAGTRTRRSIAHGMAADFAGRAAYLPPHVAALPINQAMLRASAELVGSSERELQLEIEEYCASGELLVDLYALRVAR